MAMQERLGSARHPQRLAGNFFVRGDGTRAFYFTEVSSSPEDFTSLPHALMWIMPAYVLRHHAGLLHSRPWRTSSTRPHDAQSVNPNPNHDPKTLKSNQC